MQNELSELLQSIAQLNLAFAAVNSATIDLLIRALSEQEPQRGPFVPPFSGVGQREPLPPVTPAVAEIVRASREEDGLRLTPPEDPAQYQSIGARAAALDVEHLGARLAREFGKGAESA